MSPRERWIARTTRSATCAGSAPGSCHAAARSEVAPADERPLKVRALSWSPRSAAGRTRAAPSPAARCDRRGITLPRNGRPVSGSRITPARSSTDRRSRSASVGISADCAFGVVLHAVLIAHVTSAARSCSRNGIRNGPPKSALRAACRRNRAWRCRSAERVRLRVPGGVAERAGERASVEAGRPRPVVADRARLREARGRAVHGRPGEDLRRLGVSRGGCPDDAVATGAAMATATRSPGLHDLRIRRASSRRCSSPTRRAES